MGHRLLMLTMDIMELDSENITPPSSPLLGLGYSGGDDGQSIISM